MTARCRFYPSPAIKLVALFTVAMWLQSGWGNGIAALLTSLAFMAHRSRFLKLLRRVRLLIALLFLVTLWMTPGTAVWPEWGLYPTEEGIALAVLQLVKLLGMLAAVCLLLGTTDDRHLAAGCLALLQPLAGRHQWPQRAVARLLLVFHYLETAPKPRNLQELLQLAGTDQWFETPVDAPTVLDVPDVSLSRGEQCFCLSLLLTGLAALLWMPA